MTDPLRGVNVTIAGETRTIKMTNTALRVIQAKFNNRPIREIAATTDMLQVCELTAAGLLHEDRRMTADRVDAWLEKEPHKFTVLQNAVLEALAEAYKRFAPEVEPGEGEAPHETAPTKSE